MPASDFPIELRGSQSELLRTYVRRRLHFLGSRILGPLERATIDVIPGAPSVCDLTLVMGERGEAHATASGADVKTAFDLAVEALLTGLGRDQKPH